MSSFKNGKMVHHGSNHCCPRETGTFSQLESSMPDMTSTQRCFTVLIDFITVIHINFLSPIYRGCFYTEFFLSKSFIDSYQNVRRTLATLQEVFQLKNDALKKKKKKHYQIACSLLLSPMLLEMMQSFTWQHSKDGAFQRSLVGNQVTC